MRVKKMRAAAVVSLVLLMGIFSACGGRPESTVIVAGSTSVQPYAEVLAEEYYALHPEREVDVQGGGSSAGITAALSGTANIGMSSRDLTVKEQEMWHTVIAKDGLVVIVYPGNTIDDLTIEQVRGIYEGSITNWNELGGSRDHKIHVIAREEGSGTRSAFESMVMGGVFITPKAIVQDSNGSVRQLVGNDPHSIGFISLGLVDETVKPLRLDGIAATWETIMNGSYTLYRPFVFVSNGEPAGPAKQFVDFTLSPEGQRLLQNEGLISVTEGAQE